MMQKRQRGLTLVELMVVVAVMAIIATIAYPIYTNQVQKTRRADAKVVLESVAMAEERFYTINGSYTDDYTELFTGTLAIAAGLDWPCTDGDTCNTSRGYYVIDIGHGTDDQDFTVTADASSSGPQAGDTACPSFTINHQGVKTPASGCW